LPNIRIGGPYTITATFVGYQDQKLEGVNLAIGQNFTANFKLQDSDVQLNEIVVTGAANPVLNADRTGAATNISREQIQSLPTLSRSFNDYVRLTPQAGNGSSFGGRSSGFNNITIDGALFNNAFGLSGTVGGQTNAQPISLDAVDQIAVSIAPYDVREGSFTGAGVNVVTRSGTNDFSGSVYHFFRNQSFIGKKVGGVESPVANFNLNNTGFRVGGPIIKNKLFFFLNGEIERRDDPPTPNFVAARDGLSGSNVSSARAADLDELRTFLIDTYGFDPGPYEGYKLASNSDKATARIDWNVTNNHKLSVKYNYLKSYRDVNPSNSGALNNGRNPSNTNLPFLGAFYRINNNLNSIIGEVNSTFGNRFSNKFQMGFTAFRDFRETPTAGPVFPLVDIGNGQGSQLTAFGYEPFSANNLLNTNVFQFSDNFDIYAGKHTFTIGTYNEFYKFQNGFAPFYYGGYQFNSLGDFYNSATNGVSNATRYQLRYSTAPDGSFPFAIIRAYQLGFYAQDKIDILPGLNITFGVRTDIPTINSEIGRNEQAASLVFQTGDAIQTDRLQKTQLLWSPRFGFNWDVRGDRSTQVRGGTGIFTGRVPYVWISNQASNNGVLFGSEDLTNPANRAFNPDVNAYRPAGAEASATYNLAVTDDNFRFPQVWRSNLAIDQKLPFGFVGTLEGAYTKDLNSVYHQNVNLPALSESTTAAGADDRPIYYTVFPNNTLPSRLPNGSPNPAAISGRPRNRIYNNITDAILMKNTNKGYSYFVTAQLQKTFSNGFFTSLAYTYSDAKSVNDGGSIAQSIWRDRQVSGDPNAEALSYSNFLVKHRVVGSVSYRKEYLKHFGTSISLFYSGSNNGFIGSFTTPDSRFSYTYSGDMNGDGSGGGGNDLIYVPRNQSEIALIDIRGGGQVIYSAEDQWRDLDAYISQDKYLSSRRGQYAERNGVMFPFVHQFDLRLLQDFFVNVGGKRNTFQLSLDMFNVGNFINSNWGIYNSPARQALLTFQGYDANRVPLFTFPYLNTAERTVLTNSFQDSFNINSRWQMQIGLRYIFN
jgi:hypothetical protein